MNAEKKHTRLMRLKLKKGELSHLQTCLVFIFRCSELHPAILFFSSRHQTSNVDNTKLSH